MKIMFTIEYLKKVKKNRNTYLQDHGEVILF